MKKIIPLAFLAAVIVMTACNKIDNNVNLNPKPSNYATVGNFSSNWNNMKETLSFRYPSCTQIKANRGHATRRHRVDGLS